MSFMATSRLQAGVNRLITTSSGRESKNKTLAEMGACAEWVCLLMWPMKSAHLAIALRAPEIFGTARSLCCPIVWRVERTPSGALVSTTSPFTLYAWMYHSYISKVHCGQRLCTYTTRTRSVTAARSL